MKNAIETIKELLASLENMQEYLVNNIRFQTWEKEGLGIGLNAEEMGCVNSRY